MNTPHITITLALATITSCATLEPLVGKLRQAVGDLGGKSPESCEFYVQRGRGIAEAAWTYDWKVFAPMFETEPDPVADLAFCTKVILDRGAEILTKPEGLRHSTAIGVAVLLAPDFKDKSPRRQAATLCHEAAHIVWQRRVGLPMAAADYVSVSGRLSTEATAYALGDMVLRRHGVTPEWIVGARKRRAERFPETYKLEKLVSSECVYDYLTAVSDALRERTGR